MGNIPNIPKGKKIVEKTTFTGNKEYVVRDDPFHGCWIATAYYGHSFHPDVVALRSFRKVLADKRSMGVFIKWLNEAYYKIGKTRWGKWWSEGTSSPNDVRRKVSGIIVHTLLYFARR